MADASADSSFYCHACDRMITPQMPDFTCPRCHNGFVEHMQRDAQYPEAAYVEDPGPEDNVGPSVANAMLNLFRNQHQRRRHPAQTSGSPIAMGSSTDNGESREDNDQRGSSSMRGFSISAAPGNIQIRTSGTDVDTRWIQDLFNIVLGAGWQVDQGGAGGIPILFNLPGGNLGDYAWGQQGLDNVVTQLLNQIEGQGGAPPLSPEEINNLTRTEVSQTMRDKSSQCSICMEDFQVGEEVRRLTCDHFFHEGCIIPWVERHGTCPVCRKELSTSPRSTNAPRLVIGGGSQGSSSQENADASSSSQRSRLEGSANQASANAQGLLDCTIS